MLLVIGDVDVHSSKSLRKFIEVDELVVVFVKLLENLNRIGLQVRVVLSWGLAMIALKEASGKMSPLSCMYFSVYSSDEFNMNLKPPS